MRISDSLLSNNYLNSINKIKEQMSKLNKDISTGTKIHAPSDSPSGMAKILSLEKKISQHDTYTSNVQESLAFVQETINGMEQIQGQVSDLLGMLTEVQDASKGSTIKSYAAKFNSALDAIMDSANSEFEGKYIFGGSDFSDKPYGLSADSQSVLVQVGDVSADQNVKVAPNSQQKINISGTELFGTIVNQNGNIDSSTAVGGAVNTQTSIYDAEGNEYTLTVTYTKTAANTYDLTYDIEDAGSTVVYSSPSPVEVTFNATTGKLNTIDGKSTDAVHIKDSSHKIDLNLNLYGVKESASASTFAHEANQKRDIFNTLISIRDSLNNGTVPSEEDIQAVRDFNSHVLDKLAQAGNMQNQLSNSEEMLSNQKILLQSLESNENEVDVAQAVLNMQNQDYLLQLSYKMSAMILPKSLVDFI